MKYIGIDTRNNERAFLIAPMERHRGWWTLTRLRAGESHEHCRSLKDAKAYAARLLPSVRWERAS